MASKPSGQQQKMNTTSFTNTHLNSGVIITTGNTAQTGLTPKKFFNMILEIKT